MALAFVCVAGLSATAPRAALAQEAASAAAAAGKAVLTRQGRYKDLNKTFASLAGELRKDTPDKGVILAGAAATASLAKDLPGWYPKGSGPEAGVKTAAKAEIWTDAAGFAAAATRLQDEAAKLQQVSAAGDLEAIRAQFRAIGAACKNCHDQYRASEPR